MKILHIITNTELGGAQKVCIELCRSGVKAGHTVAVASMDGGFLWTQLPEQVQQFKIPHMVKPISPKMDIKVLGELRKVMKKFKPDILQLHSSKAGILGRWVGRRMKKHVVYTVHGFDTIRLNHRVFLPLEKFFQRLCGAIVPVSNYDKTNLLNEKINRNLNCIYNGIDVNTITPEKQFPNGLDVSGKKVVLSIARIAVPKRLDLFLETARRFDSSVQFVWIGGDISHPDEDLNRLYNVPENVTLLGDVPNASNYINLCDLFVLFSNYEGLPMTIIEAMSQSKAVVASNVGGISELVDGTNGSLIKNDVDEAENAIRNALSDETALAQMGQRSLEKYKENFTIEKMWGSYESLYESLLEKK